MAKLKPVYICSSCQSVFPQWYGFCPQCQKAQSLVRQDSSAMKSSHAQSALIEELINAQTPTPQRFQTHIGELDHALGGGLVEGSVILIGGEPGIGKSTLTLQAAHQLAKNHHVVYISGEEAAGQIRLRAKRLGMDKSNLYLITETNLASILKTFQDKPDIIIIDSIQTMQFDHMSDFSGPISQLRMATQNLVDFAKRYGVAIIMVGHMTKDGHIAGPNVIAHMVDVVMYFEASVGHQFRILRASKNRYGACDEMGVFEMTAQGLMEIKNPSSLFLDEGVVRGSGSAIFAAMEGTRPLLVEIQALCAPSHFGQARRASVGCDSTRLSMILAVLEARAQIHLSHQDVYINVSGGLKITDPAADLAICAALISAFQNQAWDQKYVFFGEISLSGAIRPVAHSALRLKEAKKLGFDHAITPFENHKDKDKDKGKLRPDDHAKKQSLNPPKQVKIVKDLLTLLDGMSA